MGKEIVLFESEERKDLAGSDTSCTGISSSLPSLPMGKEPAGT